MPSLPSNRKPIFLWQALLILLPVATVTGIGLIAIRRDRVFVEEEARRGGEQLAAQCASAIARSLPLKLAAYDRFSQAWSEQQQLKARSLWHEPSDEPFAALSNSWRKATANLDPESGLPNDFACSFDGVLLWPPDYDDPPRIPQWLIRLNDQQRSAWQALLAAEFSGSSGTNLESKVDEFLNSEPPEEARLNADLITVHHESFKENNLQEFLGLQAFGARCSRARSESGLPLTTLIALEGLRAGRQPGAQYNLLAVDMNDSGGFVGQTLDWSFHEPSVLTPVIIGQLEQMVPSAAQSARLMPAIKAAWARWAAQQRFHQMARLIRSQGLLRNASPTNFWLQCDSGLWFCAATSGRIALRQTMADSSAVWTTNEAALLRTYPAGFIDQAAEQCVHELGPSIPDYAGVQFRIERELVGTVERAEQLSFQAVPIGVLGSDPHRNHRVGGSYFLEGTKAATKTSSRVLAETLASFESYPDAWSINMRAVLPEAVMLPGGTRSSVRFKLQLLLIDPDRLFMRQRQRSWFFGGVILASAFTACVGLAAAYRSFRRQLRLNELKSNFVSSVSHELRAPIASVRLMAESLDRGKIGDPRKQHEYFRFIVQECRRLSSLIENVLDFSRIEQGRKELEFEPTDIRALTDQTVKLMETYATDRDVALRLSIGPDVPASLQLDIDGKAIQQALVNLIDNAIKHSNKGQAVTIGMGIEQSSEDNSAGRLGEARIVLWVEDNGEGIPAEEHEKIFERFYRLGSELRRQTEGVGIGLSIVRHIVEAHGGKVHVRSAPGQGSRFTIDLPGNLNRNSTEETSNAH